MSKQGWKKTQVGYFEQYVTKTEEVKREAQSALQGFYLEFQTHRLMILIPTVMQKCRRHCSNGVFRP